MAVLTKRSKASDNCRRLLLQGFIKASAMIVKASFIAFATAHRTVLLRFRRTGSGFC